MTTIPIEQIDVLQSAVFTGLLMSRWALLGLASAVVYMFPSSTMQRRTAERWGTASSQTFNPDRYRTTNDGVWYSGWANFLMDLPKNVTYIVYILVVATLINAIAGTGRAIYPLFKKR